MATRKVLDKALSIGELGYVMRNISVDDCKPIEDYTDEEILAEAKYVLGLFHEGGTAQHEMLYSVEERDEARRQIRNLKALLKLRS